MSQLLLICWGVLLILSNPSFADSAGCPSDWAGHRLNDYYLRGSLNVCDYQGSMTSTECSNLLGRQDGGKHGRWCQKFDDEAKTRLLSLSLVSNLNSVLASTLNGGQNPRAGIANPIDPSSATIKCPETISSSETAPAGWTMAESVNSVYSGYVMSFFRMKVSQHSTPNITCWYKPNQDIPHVSYPWLMRYAPKGSRCLVARKNTATCQ